MVTFVSPASKKVLKVVEREINTSSYSTQLIFRNVAHLRTYAYYASPDIVSVLLSVLYCSVFYTVSVLGRDEGYTVKYNPLPEGVPEGEGRGNS